MATEAEALNGAVPAGEGDGPPEKVLAGVPQERAMLLEGAAEIAATLARKGYQALVRDPHLVWLPEADRPFYAIDLVFVNPHQQPQPQPTLVGITLASLAETLRGAIEIGSAQVSASLVMPRNQRFPGRIG